jgi:hypothetical protein
VQPKITDVELLKKKVRKIAAGRVLAGEQANVGLDLGRLAGCRVCITAGYGSLSTEPASVPYDRLLWLLDGYGQVYGASGQVTNLSQGESVILAGGVAYRLVFPKLSIYLSVESREDS